MIGTVQATWSSKLQRFLTSKFQILLPSPLFYDVDINIPIFIKYQFKYEVMELTAYN